MSQNSIIAFGLLVGFVVFITVKGELPSYLAVIGLSNQPLPKSCGGAAPTASSAPAVNPLNVQSPFGGSGGLSSLDTLSNPLGSTNTLGGVL